MVKGKDPDDSKRDKKSGRSSNKTPSGFEADSDNKNLIIFSKVKQHGSKWCEIKFLNMETKKL